MSELWLGRCNKTIPSLRQRRGIGEIAPVNILNNLNNEEQGCLRNRSVELDTPDCNLSSLSGIIVISLVYQVLYYTRYYIILCMFGVCAQICGWAVGVRLSSPAL